MGQRRANVTGGCRMVGRHVVGGFQGLEIGAEVESGPVQVTAVPVAAESAESAEPASRLRARVATSVRRQPVVALTATWVTVLVVGAWVQAAVPVVLTVQVIAWVVLTQSRRPAGTQTHAAAAAATRGFLLPVAAVVVALHLVQAGRAALDHALLLGAVAALVGSVCAAVRAAHTRPPRVLVVGDLPQVRGLAARWFDDRSVDIVGALAIGVPADAAVAGLQELGITSVGATDDVVDFLTDQPADLVVVASGPRVGPDDIARLAVAVETCGARLALISAVEHVAPHRLDVEVIAGSSMTLVTAPGPTWAGTLVKSLIDRTIAAVLLVLVAPLLAVAALAIRLDSPGRAVFTQSRVGRHGRLFTVYKLRTMTADAEQEKLRVSDLDEGNGVLFKIRQDPRITRVGRWLRTTSLDELPQLLNVVRGDMSLVGPRPALPEEVARYTSRERRRLAVKPGITGLWQVSGRSTLSRERSMRLDTSYVDNWRLASDGHILARTVGAVVSRRGAY